MRRLPPWMLWPLAALAPLLVAAMLAILPHHLSVQVPGNGVLWVRWDVLCPALATAFGLPLLAARVLVKTCRWWALAAGGAGLIAVALVGRLWPAARGGGTTLAWIAVASSLVGLGAGLLAGEKLGEALG